MTTSTKKIKKKVWTSLGVWAAIAGLWAVSVAVTGIAAPAHADPYSDDGLSASVTPVKVRPNVSAVFTLTVTDLNSSGVQFDTYILTGLPQGWILRNGATRLNPISPDPIIYQFPAPDAWAGRITIEPPNGFTGTLSSVTVGRVKSSPNLIVDFDNGSFDYIGQAKPTLPSRNTNYGYHDPHQLYTVPPSCTSTQYGPCDGDYTIWPTANINGPQHQIYGHYNNYWADLRSISNPMTSPTTAEVCARWDEILSNGSATNTLQVTNSQSASSGKIAIFNGATDMPIPNDLVTTTVSGLVPNQAYVFNAYVANLSDDPRGGTRPVRTAAYVKKSDSDIGILIGSTQPLPVQAGCHTYNTGWVHSSAIVMTGSSGQLILSLRNYAAGGFGNDLAIDNLSLYPLATVPIEMTVAAAAPELLISKSADPASGSMVFAGQEITYTLTGKNSGDTDLRPVVLTDNLAGVLSHADYVVGSATALIDGNPVALPVLSGTTLTWSGTLTATQSVTVTYRVKVHSDVQPSDHLVNRLTGRGEDPDEPGTEVPGICIEGEEEECSTTHTPGVPGLLIAKTSDPTSGSTLRPGQTVTYTVTAVNTGNVVLDPVVVSDDLRKVLNHTSFVAGSLRATIDGLPTTMPYFTGSQLTWTGVLPVGKTVTLTYKVTVNMDVTSSDVLVNAVIGRGETPEDPGHDVPSNCVTGEEEGCYTTLTPIISKLEIYKESNPVSGSTVFAGQIITYTLHATNTGDIGLDPVILTDDMAGVLGHARFVPGSASAILDGTRVVAPALAGSTLTWIGPLAPGKSVDVSYQVIVDQDVSSSDHLVNRLTGRGEDPDEPGTEVPGICVPGEDDDCTTIHNPGVPGLMVAKSSNPESGSTVRAGQMITYTVTAANTGNVDLDPVVLVDDLSRVLAYARFVAGSPTAMMGSAPAPLPTIIGSKLIWSDKIPIGKTVTLTYQVIVNDNVATGDVLVNAVTGRGENPEDPGNDVPSNCVTGEEEGCHTTLTPVIPRLEIHKEANPASGSMVFAGSRITYTLTGVNSGDIDLNPVTLTDDLSGVINHASFQPGSAVARVDGIPVGSPTLSGSTLTWSGPLAAGKSVTVTYQVVVHNNVLPTDHLVNRLLGQGEDPGEPGDEVPGICVPEVEDCTTTHDPGVPGLQVAKTSDPINGSKVRIGQTITYTITAVNTGNTVLDPVVLDDDLGSVLTSASFVADSWTAQIAGAPAPLPTLDGSILRWTSSLQVGQSVVLSYKVRVNADVTDKDLLINAVIGTADNPEDPGGEVPSNCVTGQEDDCTTTLTPVIPGLDVRKTSNPFSGSFVDPGEILTYTVVGTNTGSIDLDPVVLVDDLSGVLTHARMIPDSITAMIDQDLVSPPTITGTTLIWSGPLAIGDTVTLTYQVIVDDTIKEAVWLVNRVTGRGTDPEDPDSEVPSPCITGEEDWCHTDLEVIPPPDDDPPPPIPIVVPPEFPPPSINTGGTTLNAYSWHIYLTTAAFLLAAAVGVGIGGFRKRIAD